MDASLIQARLTTRFTGRDLRVYDSLESTGITARTAARRSAPCGTAVVAAKQTAGRGRFGRAWASPRGGLWMSLILRPGADPGALPHIPMAAALALQSALVQDFGLMPDLAWPNDLVLGGAKLAGLIMEPCFQGNNLEFAILGIGVNGNNPPGLLPEDVRATAVSCAQALGHDICLENLAAGLLNRFEPLYMDICAGRCEAVFAQWKSALDLIGRSVAVRQDQMLFQGVVGEILAGGGLELILADGKKAAIPMDRGSIHTNKYSKKL